MNHQQLLVALLECSFGGERKLLKQNEYLANDRFASILKQVAAQAQENHRQSWAKIQYLLGLVYFYHVEDSALLKQAIAYFNKALTVFSESDFPVEWATVQNYLGNVCRRLDEGELETNISKAIAFYQNALRVRQRDLYRQEWCSTQYNLGVAYGMLADVVVETDRDSCLAQAKACFENFLDVTTPEDEPEWAETKIAVGALTQELEGEIVDRLRYALNCYQEPRKVAEARGDREVVASACDYLGHGYRELSKHENTQVNLERAYYAYRHALGIYDRATQPYNWAATQNDLGLVLIAAGKIEQAIACFQQALTVFTPTTFPVECSRIGRNLGNLAYDNRLCLKAIAGYERAIEAVEISRDRTNSDEQRQAIIQKALDVYSRMVQACIESGTEAHLAKAIETVERSRSRYLTDLIATHDLYQQGDISQGVRSSLAKYERLQQQIDELRSRYDKKINPDDDSIRNSFKSAVDIKNNRWEIPPEAILQLETWEVEKKEVWQELRKSDPVLAGQVRVEPQEFSQLQKLIDSPTTAILSFYSAFDHTYIFVLSQSGICYHLCPNQSLEHLNAWLQENWFEPYQSGDSQKKSWIANMESTLQQLATKLDLDGLVNSCLADLTELIIVPHQLLHLIPFAALPLGDESYFGDRFALRVVLSCQVLAFCQERKQNLPPFAYGTVVYSQSGLAFSKIEEKLIAQMYGVPLHRRLKEERANKDNYHRLLHAEKVQAILSNHHAKFDLANPLDSELTLANSKLTLLELLTLKWRMTELNEVFLSCCETGLGNPAATDDLLTLAAGFLCSGARSVISSLWVVDDGSTALLSFFYHQARLDGLSRPCALQQAQKRLRNLSDRDLETADRDFQSALLARKKKQNALEQEKSDREYFFRSRIWQLISEVLAEKRSQPLSHPFYWAAFTCQGLA
ncbi:MAG: CHAT domain-containing tetratricopeptide repeat protein [Cyanobacteria bacterium J06582_2]